MTLSSDISTTSTALSDIKSAIIAKGVTPSGNITTYATAISNIPTGGIGIPREVVNGVYQPPSESFTFSLPNNVTTIPVYGLSYSLYYCTGITSVSFPAVTTILGSGLESTFSNCANLTTVSFPNLTTISGSYALQNAFSYCANLTTVSFPTLANISGYGAMTNAFSYCTNLTTVIFNALNDISSSSIFSRCFSYCTNLQSLSFPALTTTSFGSYKNQFSSMMQGTGTTKTHTIHFPSNMQSTISDLTGYPLFGGTSGYVTLSFDLPATS